jgi:hypothetical protein
MLLKHFSHTSCTSKQELLTLLARGIADEEAAAASCLDKMLLSNSSFGSAPVFFDFGEPNAEANPSLKTDDELILSVYVVGLHIDVDCAAPG